MTAPSQPTPSTKPPAIVAAGLARRFGRRWAVAHLDLEIGAGETVLLAGANGSGKTTLLRMLCGLCTPSRGQLRVLGTDPTTERTRARARISLISHQSYLYNGMTALETVDLWLELLGSGARTDAKGAAAGLEADARELLTSVDLAEAADTPVAGFSQGMRKRLTLLRAAIEPSDLVLLDEPFAALDPRGQALVARWIREFAAQGRTVVFASHALAAARSMARRAILLHRGQIAWDGPAVDLPDSIDELLASRVPR